jgi:hypothetical protein
VAAADVVVPLSSCVTYDEVSENTATLSNAAQPKRATTTRIVVESKF